MSSESCSSSFIFLRTNSSYFFIPSSFQFILVHWNSPGSLLSPYSPRALTIFLDPQIAICQLFGPDSEGVWESTHKVSADSVEGNGSFCKKCNFALWKKSTIGRDSAYIDIIRPKIPPRGESCTKNMYYYMRLSGRKCGSQRTWSHFFWLLARI